MHLAGAVEASTRRSAAPEHWRVRLTAFCVTVGPRRRRRPDFPPAARTRDSRTFARTGRARCFARYRRPAAARGLSRTPPPRCFDTLPPPSPRSFPPSISSLSLSVPTSLPRLPDDIPRLRPVDDVNRFPRNLSRGEFLRSLLCTHSSMSSSSSSPPPPLPSSRDRCGKFMGTCVRVSREIVCARVCHLLICAYLQIDQESPRALHSRAMLARHGGLSFGTLRGVHATSRP